MATEKKIVPDTSVLISGKLLELLKEGKLDGSRIIIPKAVVDELQAQASTGREIGFKGLESIKNIRKIGREKKIAIEFSGTRPTFEEIQLARKGRIDALIRDVAHKEQAKLLTSDYVQALVAEAEDIEVEHIPKTIGKTNLLEKFFTPETQSAHLKADAVPVAKVGKPGQVKLVELRKEKITEDEATEIINDVVQRARMEENGFIEISKLGALVVQLGNLRVSIAKPPFSDGLELTAVRPIAKVTLDDYKLHKELEKGLLEKSIGMLISGPPGSGKSSFAAALAEFIASHGKIVKTFEQPRDLQVGPEITQYAPLEGDWEKTAEILLLVRPDYTIFDEIRRTHDFRVFSDMRLAGVGMIGVIHATTAVSAIQRFVGRIELGVIPHIIDTVIFIKDGAIKKVYELALIVKVPTGMVEQDLARPVVEIRDFETKELEYEIYTYGEENVIIPVSKDEGAASPIQELAKERIFQELRHYDHEPIIEIQSDNRITVRVRSDAIARLIGKSGANIEQLEKKLGVKISVEPKEGTLKRPVQYHFFEAGNSFLVKVDDSLINKQVDLYDSSTFIASFMIGKKGNIRVRKKSEIGSMILQALTRKSLKVVV
ncbi:MAG: Flp pilus assembly complex ATPase component TadA [Candidatus Aenigmarchaeota archaeon]|nr:Flp pilus assembly complex ATPase component TadA [Candidatus Aenigmarchaeota archaeon]